MSSLVLYFPSTNALSEMESIARLLIVNQRSYPFLANICELELPDFTNFFHFHAVIKQFEPKNYQWIIRELP